MFVRNLFVIIVLGVLVSAWIIAYTDWFAEFAGLLALGGLFSWLAFVAKILPEERLKEFQNWVDTFVLSGERTSSVLGYMLIFGVLISMFLGTVQVESVDTSDRGLIIARGAGGREAPANPSEQEGEAERLPPGGRIRAIFWTLPFWPTTARVKVTGYPYQMAPIHPWRVSELYVPASFLRPALLVKPGPKLMSFRSGFSIRIYLSTTTAPETVWDNVAFDGHAFWIGCDRDVEIPRHTVEVLQERLGSLSDKSQAQRLWFNVHAGSVKSLPVGANIRLKIVSNGKELPGGVTDIVGKPDSYLDFPQLLEIEAP
jgi:hypothetical protein